MDNERLEDDRSRETIGDTERDVEGDRELGGKSMIDDARESMGETVTRDDVLDCIESVQESGMQVFDIEAVPDSNETSEDMESVEACVR